MDTSGDNALFPDIFQVQNILWYFYENIITSQINISISFCAVIICLIFLSHLLECLLWKLSVMQSQFMLSAPLEYSEDCGTMIYGDETHISPVVPVTFLPCCTSSAPGTNTERQAGDELVKQSLF